MASIIIAAHNEEAVLGATLDDLAAAGTEAQIVVVANGCRDATAEVARSRAGITVLDLAEGGKANALNKGEAVATSFPLIYLDADISVPVGTVEALVSALSGSPALVAVPGRELDLTDRPWPVRAWAAIHQRLPVFRDGLFGRGMIAVSEEGRSRFGSFPLMVADDLFLDSLYTADEKAHVDQYRVTVETPPTTTELLNRLTRVRRGSSAMRRASETGAVEARVRRPDRWSWLRDVVAKEPRLLPAGVVYATLTAIAAVRARRGPMDTLAWGRDVRRAER